MHSIPLEGPWRFRVADRLHGDAPIGLELNQWMPATVPGTVHYQLEQEGNIPDPWFGRNELQLQWIDQQDWEWSTVEHYVHFRPV